jgi:hypothetical protein
MQRDSSNQTYEEIEISSGFVRVTYVPNGWDDSPSVRIQIRDENGHLRQGPEIPISAVGGVLGAVVNLLTKQHK